MKSFEGDAIRIDPEDRWIGKQRGRLLPLAFCRDLAVPVNEVSYAAFHVGELRPKLSDIVTSVEETVRSRFPDPANAPLLIAPAPRCIDTPHMVDLGDVVGYDSADAALAGAGTVRSLVGLEVPYRLSADNALRILVALMWLHRCVSRKALKFREQKPGSADEFRAASGFWAAVGKRCFPFVSVEDLALEIGMPSGILMRFLAPMIEEKLLLVADVGQLLRKGDRLPIGRAAKGPYGSVAVAVDYDRVPGLPRFPVGNPFLPVPYAYGVLR